MKTLDDLPSPATSLLRSLWSTASSFVPPEAPAAPLKPSTHSRRSDPLLPMSRCYIDFASGDEAAYDAALERYNSLVAWLAANGAKYGLAAKLDELDESGRETLMAVYEGDTKVCLHFYPAVKRTVLSRGRPTLSLESSSLPVLLPPCPSPCTS